MYVHVHTHTLLTYTHMHTHAHTHITHTCTYTHKCTHSHITHTCTYTHTHTHTLTHTCTYTHTHTCTHTHICTHMPTQASDYAEALVWYNYSLSFFPAQEGRDKNIAKLQVKSTTYTTCARPISCFSVVQRNRCSCYINLKDFDRVRNLEDFAHVL